MIPAATVLFRADPALTGQLLEALSRGGRRVYVFVNGAIASEIETQLAQLDAAVIMRSAANVGQGAALNAIVGTAASAGADQLLLFDQDSTPDPHYPERLARAVSALKIGRRLAVAGPRLIAPESGHLTIRAYRKQPGHDLPYDAVEFVATSGSLLSIECWRAIGPFRDDFFVDGIDVEWCQRAWSKGYVTVHVPEVALTHRWGSERKHDAGERSQLLLQSPVRNYYYLRNKIFTLGLPHVPRRFRAREWARLTAQIVYLALRAPGQWWRVVPVAVRDGVRGRLGPCPASVQALESQQ